jgi:hypothetical protein
MEALFGLFAAGSYLSNDNEKDDDTTSDVDTIYDSQKSGRNRRKVRNLAKKKTANKNSVGPTYRDKRSNMSDASSASSDFSDSESDAHTVQSAETIENHTSLMDNANNMTRNLRPGYLDQFDDLRHDNKSGIVAHTQANQGHNGKSRRRALNQSQNIEFDGGYSPLNDNNMTYGVVDREHFVHDNMVPHFAVDSSKGYGRSTRDEKQYEDTTQRRLDLFSGSTNNIEHLPKKESRPLFNPIVGLTNIYGNRNINEEVQWRYQPSRERRNEKPFQPTKVTPGMNLGHNEVGRHGFHDQYRPELRTIDDLRTANNPQTSYVMPVRPNRKHGENRPVVAPVRKRRPDRFVENDPRNMQKSMGHIKGPTVRGTYYVPTTMRSVNTRGHMGAAKYETSQHLPQNMYEKVKISTKENFDHAGPRAPHAKEHHAPMSATIGSYNAPVTKRQLTQNNTYQRPVGTRERDQGGYQVVHQGIHMPTTIRQITQNNTYQRPIGTRERDQGGYQVQHQNTQAPATLRQTTQHNTYQRPIGTRETDQGGYQVQHQNTQAPATLRQTTQHNTYQRPIGTRERDQGGYQVQHQNTHAPTTLRQTTQHNTYQRPIGTRERDQGGYHVQHQGIHMPTTKRQLTQNNTHNGQVGTKDRQQGGYQVQHQNTQAPTTKRQLTQINTHNGQIGTKDRQQGGYHAEQSGIHMPTTKRQLTQNNTHNGQIGTRDRQQGGYQVQHQNTHAPTTKRQLTQNNTHNGQIGTRDRQQGGYQVQHQNTHAPTTKRQLTQNNTYQQPVGTRDRHKGGYHAEQEGIHMPTTKRQLTQNNTYQQPIGTRDRHKGGYHAEQDGIHMPTTKRQLTQNNTYQQPIGTKDREKGGYHAEQEGIHMPTTKRQLTQNNTYQQPLGTKDREKGGYHIELQGTHVPTTKKQMMQNNTYQQPLKFHEAQASRADAEAMLQTTAKDEILQGRAPTTSNYTKIPTYEHTMYTLRDPIQVNRDLYPNMTKANILDCIPTYATKDKNTLPQQEDRHYSFPKVTLKTNPYINNIIHKSVEY